MRPRALRSARQDGFSSAPGSFAAPSHAEQLPHHLQTPAASENRPEELRGFCFLPVAVLQPGLAALLNTNNINRVTKSTCLCAPQAQRSGISADVDVAGLPRFGSGELCTMKTKGQLLQPPQPRDPPRLKREALLSLQPPRAQWLRWEQLHCLDQNPTAMAGLDKHHTPISSQRT